MTAKQAAKRGREATCAAILDATAEIVTAKGLDGYTISEIARRAGVNRALIYHYYQDRENLVTHAIDRIMGRYNVPAARLGEGAVVSNARAFIEHPEIGRFIFQLLLSGRPLLRLGERFTRMLDHLEQLKRQQFPHAKDDRTFSILILTLSLFAWSFSREELARLLGLSVDEADDRFVEELRHISDLELRSLAAGRE